MRRPVKGRNKPTPDHRYQSTRVSQLINYVMERGKKEVSRGIVYGVFDRIKKDTNQDPVEVFETALRNAGPTVEVRSRRVGGANYQVPHEVRPERRTALALRWIIGAARGKKGAPMNAKLYDELMAASRNEGEAVKKRDTMHKMAEANRAFAHFGWTSKKK